MDNRSFESGAGAVAPTAPASPSAGFPQKGNPATGTPATRPGVWWYHMIGEELRSILVAAGIAPDPNNLTQLLTALRSAGVFQTQATNDSSTKAATTAFANPGASIGVSGYHKLPSGLIIQWGTATLSAGLAAVIFPIAFPNACLFSTTGDDQGIGSNIEVTNTFGKTLTGVSIAGQSNPGVGGAWSALAGVVTWLAIGY